MENRNNQTKNLQIKNLQIQKEQIQKEQTQQNEIEKHKIPQNEIAKHKIPQEKIPQEKIPRNRQKRTKTSQKSPQKPQKPQKSPKSTQNPPKKPKKQKPQKPKKPQKPPVFFATKSLSRLEIIGFNQMRILNTLSKNNIRLLKIARISPKILHVTFAKKDLPLAQSILGQMGYDHRIIKEFSPFSFTRTMVKNIGILAGILTFSLLAFLSNNLIWSVQISGNDLIDSHVIELELNKNGIKRWSNKNALSPDQIASILRQIDGIAEGTAHVNGTTLYVTVAESQIFVPPDQEDLSGDIVSNYDAQITKIVTKKGTACVKVGEIVALGETLIKGEIYNSNGELMETCRAKGEVFGKVSFSQTHIFSPVEEVFEPTDNTKKQTYFTIFGARVGKSDLDGTSGWDKKTVNFSSFLLPIRFTQITYTQTKLTTRERNIDDYVSKLKQSAIVENVLKAGGSEIETVTTLTQIEGGLLRLNIHIQAEIKIAQF